MRLTVRKPEPSEKEAILSLVARAFTGPDHDGNEEAQIVLDTWRLGAVISGLELVAVDREVLVGHVLGARGRQGSPPFVAVAPLSVDPSHQRQGVGTALMAALLRHADRQRWPAVVLLGDPSYYGRFGFEPSGPTGVFYDIVGRDSPYFQIRRLSAFDASAQGSFHYCWEA